MADRAPSARRHLVPLEASAAADAVAVCPWDGTGDEQPERYSAWLAAAWQLVDARRAELADQTLVNVQKGPSPGAE